jgi:membrane protease YdiL (CAAX protease family)
MLMLAAAYLSMFFMPETAERAAQLSDFTTTVPFPLAILITAVMPAVCEEALHRGFIMASFRTLKDEPRLKGRTALVKVLVIGLCGLVFGLFHLDPVRLLPTAILGGVFAYMNIKTESILPSVIMHFTNNVFSVISMYAMSALQQAVPDEQLEAAMRAAESAAESSVFTNFRAVAGIAMILAGLALLLLYGGIRMLNRVKRGVGGAYAYANPDFGENPPQGYAATQEGDFPGAPGRDTYTELTSLPERISASPLAKAVAVLLTSLVLLSSGGVLIITSGALPQERPYSFVSIFDHDRGIYEETTAAETVSAETTSSETASDEPPASI